MIIKKATKYGLYGLLFGLLGGYLAWNNRVEDLGVLFMFSLFSAIPTGILFFIIILIFEWVKSKVK